MWINVIRSLFLSDIKKMRNCDLFAMQIRIFNKNNLMNTREIILGIRVSTLFDRDKACENLGFFCYQITCRGLKETRPETKSATYESSYFRFSIIFIARLQQNVKGRKKIQLGRVRFCTFWVWNLIKWYWRLRFVFCSAFFLHKPELRNNNLHRVFCKYFLICI